MVEVSLVRFHHVCFAFADNIMNLAPSSKKIYIYAKAEVKINFKSTWKSSYDDAIKRLCLSAAGWGCLHGDGSRCFRDVGGAADWR